MSSGEMTGGTPLTISTLLCGKPREDAGAAAGPPPSSFTYFDTLTNSMSAALQNTSSSLTQFP
jgi:hypothetical protein